MKIRVCAMDCGNELYGSGDICTQCTRLVARHKEKKTFLSRAEERRYSLSKNKSRRTEAV